MGDLEGETLANRSNPGGVFQPGFNEDSFKRDEVTSMRQDPQDAIDMSVPERIVLSAGYDGDDSASDVKRVTSDIFSEQAIPAPDVAMVGMRAPPSTLTVDDSSGFYPRPVAGAGRTSDGDGSDRIQSPYRMNIGRRDLSTAEEDGRSSDEELVSDRAVVIGNENGHLPVVVARGDAFTRLQRKVAILERALDEQQSRSSLWTYALVALSFLNPIIITYLFNRSK